MHVVLFRENYISGRQSGSMLRMMNSRSLHFAPLDFLWNLMALLHLMRLSLRKGAHVALSSAAWQEIQVRSRLDDNSVWVQTSRF
jgi:hypothetical protein